MIQILGLFSLIVITFPALALAQNEGNPGGFFSDNYARELLEQPKKPWANSETLIEEEQVQRPRPATRIKTESTAKSSTLSDLDSEQSPDSTNVMEMSAGVPIESLNAIINVQDTEHFIKHITELKDVVVQYNVQPGIIVLVGYAEIDPLLELFAPIVVRGGQVTADMTITETYQTSLSPTWVIRTEKGDMVLEAVPSLSRFLTSKGELQAHHLE